MRLVALTLNIVLNQTSFCPICRKYTFTGEVGDLIQKNNIFWGSEPPFLLMQKTGPHIAIAKLM